VTRILLIVAGVLGAGLAGTLLIWIPNLYDSRAQARADRDTAVAANVSLVKEAAAAKAEAARITAQSIRLTEANRALVAAGASLQASLSDAAKSCPVIDADLRALDRLLNPAPGGDAGGTNPPGRPAR
jgi:hypothetical protein